MPITPPRFGILTDGNYELQTYERSLSGNTMTLHFFRMFPGRPDWSSPAD